MFEEKELYTMINNKAMYFDSNSGILFEDFYRNNLLSHNIIPTTFVVDKTGNLTISSFEFKDFPFYGTQFQFDKIAYTVNEEKEMDHSYPNIQVNRKFGDFFIEESKKNYQKFTDKVTELKLIFEDLKLRYNHKMKKYIYLIKESDDENDNVIFVQ